LGVVGLYLNKQNKNGCDGFSIFRVFSGKKNKRGVVWLCVSACPACPVRKNDCIGVGKNDRIGVSLSENNLVLRVWVNKKNRGEIFPPIFLSIYEN